MTAQHHVTSGHPVSVVGERSTLRAVAVPAEHGGWSLTLEPVLLGLWVRWSWSGAALGAAALMAFVARTPLKVVLVDRWRGRRLPRTTIARRVVSVELLMLAVLVTIAVRGADDYFWVPLLAALPLVVVELWFDMRSRSRRLLPELTGTIGIGSVAAAIALVDDAPTRMALGLWVVVAARAVAAIPYARTQVARARGKESPLWRSDIAQVLAAASVSVAWWAGAVPWLAAIAIAAVAGFNLGAVRLAPRAATTIGLQQMLFGGAVIALTAIAVRA